MAGLAEKECVPCKGGVPPLPEDRVQELLKELNDWSVEGGHHLTRTFTFADFAKALAFVNRVGVMADEQGHHPDVYLTWGKVRLDVWTHKIDGLTESDFVFAAKVDQLRAS